MVKGRKGFLIPENILIPSNAVSITKTKKIKKYTLNISVNLLIGLLQKIE